MDNNKLAESLQDIYLPIVEALRGDFDIEKRNQKLFEILKSGNFFKSYPESFSCKAEDINEQKFTEDCNEFVEWEKFIVDFEDALKKNSFDDSNWSPQLAEGIYTKFVFELVPENLDKAFTYIEKIKNVGKDSEARYSYIHAVFLLFYRLGLGKNIEVRKGIAKQTADKIIQFLLTLLESENQIANQYIHLFIFAISILSLEYKAAKERLNSLMSEGIHTEVLQFFYAIMALIYDRKFLLTNDVDLVDISDRCFEFFANFEKNEEIISSYAFLLETYLENNDIVKANHCLDKLSQHGFATSKDHIRSIFSLMLNASKKRAIYENPYLIRFENYIKWLENLQNEASSNFINIALAAAFVAADQLSKAQHYLTLVDKSTVDLFDAQVLTANWNSNAPKSEFWRICGKEALELLQTCKKNLCDPEDILKVNSSLLVAYINMKLFSEAFQCGMEIKSSPLPEQEKDEILLEILNPEQLYLQGFWQEFREKACEILKPAGKYQMLALFGKLLKKNFEEAKALLHLSFSHKLDEKLSKMTIVLMLPALGLVGLNQQNIDELIALQEQFCGDEESELIFCSFALFSSDPQRRLQAAAICNKYEYKHRLLPLFPKIQKIMEYLQDGQWEASVITNSEIVVLLRDLDKRSLILKAKPQELIIVVMLELFSLIIAFLHALLGVSTVEQCQSLINLISLELTSLDSELFSKLKHGFGKYLTSFQVFLGVKSFCDNNSSIIPLQANELTFEFLENIIDDALDLGDKEKNPAAWVKLLKALQSVFKDWGDRLRIDNQFLSSFSYLLSCLFSLGKDVESLDKAIEQKFPMAYLVKGEILFKGMASQGKDVKSAIEHYQTAIDICNEIVPDKNISDFMENTSMRSSKEIAVAKKIRARANLLMSQAKVVLTHEQAQRDMLSFLTHTMNNLQSSIPATIENTIKIGV